MYQSRDLHLQPQLRINNNDFYYEKDGNSIDIDLVQYNIFPKEFSINHGSLISIATYIPSKFKKDPIYKTIWQEHGNLNRLVMDNKKSENAASKITGLILVYLLENELIDQFSPDNVIHAPIFYEDSPPSWYKEKTYVDIASRELRIKSIYNLLKKDHNFSMKGLSYEERRMMAEKHFIFSESKYNLANKNVLFIDDIITSASTSEVISEKLVENFGINDFLGAFAGKTENPGYQ